jgi:hypothetical protein
MKDWPFTSYFLDLYLLARQRDWKWNNKPVTIAWLLGYYSGSTLSPSNVFRPNSPAWYDYRSGMDCFISNFQFGDK